METCQYHTSNARLYGCYADVFAFTHTSFLTIMLHKNEYKCGRKNTCTKYILFEKY